MGGPCKKNDGRWWKTGNDGPELKNILVPGGAGPWWPELAGPYNGINEVDDPVMPHFFRGTPRPLVAPSNT